MRRPTPGYSSKQFPELRSRQLRRERIRLRPLSPAVRHALEARRPKVAVLAYADFHDERNTFCEIDKKGIVPWKQAGAARAAVRAGSTGAGHVRYSMARSKYSEFPLMRYLALAHYGRETVRPARRPFYRSHASRRPWSRRWRRSHGSTMSRSSSAGISGKPLTLRDASLSPRRMGFEYRHRRRSPGERVRNLAL